MSGRERVRDVERMADAISVALETVCCPLCGADEEHRPWLIVRDRNLGRPGEFPVVTCERCGLYYLRERPVPEAQGEYYPDEYYPLDPGQESPEALREARVQLRFLTEHYSPASMQAPRVLDLGCGTGLFLKLARDAGFGVHGVEMNPAAVRVGRDIHRLPVDQGEVLDADLPGASFEAVMMWHVLEHLPEPVRALERARELLVPGGLVIFAVPNVASLEAFIFGRRWYSLDAPRHLLHFSPDTAARAVGDSGLELVRIRHSRSTVGLVYSLMGDLTGVSLRLRGRGLSGPSYHLIARLLNYPAWPVCRAAAAVSRGGAIEVVARRPV